MTGPESVGGGGQPRGRGRAGQNVWHLGSRPVLQRTTVQPRLGDPASVCCASGPARLEGGPRGSAHAWLESQPCHSQAVAGQGRLPPRSRPRFPLHGGAQARAFPPRLSSQCSYLKWPWFASFFKKKKKKIIPVLSRVPQGQLSPLKMSVVRQPPVRRWEEAGGPDGNAGLCGWN